MKEGCGDALHREKDLLDEIVFGHAAVDVGLHHVLGSGGFWIQSRIHVTSRKASIVLAIVLIDDGNIVHSTYRISRPKPTWSPSFGSSNRKGHVWTMFASAGITETTFMRGSDVVLISLYWYKSSSLSR